MKRLLCFTVMSALLMSCEKNESEEMLKIGDNYQGGIIAYILQPNDPGYDKRVQHGLIAAPNDLSGIANYVTDGYGNPIITENIQWDTFYKKTNAKGTAIGTGYENTVAIVTTAGNGSYAAKWCFDLVLNGYSDWYLPSKDELNKLYINRTVIGGFEDDIYWSSTESDYVSPYCNHSLEEKKYGPLASYAFIQNFDRDRREFMIQCVDLPHDKEEVPPGVQMRCYKGELNRVRPIRSF